MIYYPVAVIKFEMANIWKVILCTYCDYWQGCINSLVTEVVTIQNPVHSMDYFYTIGTSVMKKLKTCQTSMMEHIAKIINVQAITFKILSYTFVRVLNPFQSNVPSLYPLKTLENQSFSDIFRGYRMEHWAKMGQ